MFGAGFLPSVQNLIIIELNMTLKSVSFSKQAEDVEKTGKYTGVLPAIIFVKIGLGGSFCD